MGMKRQSGLKAFVKCAERRVCMCCFRVKELGPGGPVEGKPADVAPPNNVDIGTMSPQNSDLAMLKTSNVI